MVWDYPEALEVLASDDARGCVAAVLCGHDHFGHYHYDEATGVQHCTFCSPLNKGDDGDAFGLVLVSEQAIEIRGPQVDDLLPAQRGSQPTGRPAKTAVAADGYTGPCESIILPLRPRASKSGKPGEGASSSAGVAVAAAAASAAGGATGLGGTTSSSAAAAA